MSSYTINDLKTTHHVTNREKTEIIDHCNQHDIKPVVYALYPNEKDLIRYYQDVYSMDADEVTNETTDNPKYKTLSTDRIVEFDD